MTKKNIIANLRAIERPGMMELLLHMEYNGFFTASCSGSYHLAKDGGLAEHSENVMHLALQLADAWIPNPTDEFRKSVVLCALLHDLGKMGDYGKPFYTENILKSGNRSESKPFTRNKDLLNVPHEIRSIKIASKFIDLSETEANAILYHNGRYTSLGYDWHEDELSMIIHFADLWASRVTEREV